MSKTSNSDVGKRMAAAGFTSEQVADAALAERVARLLKDAAPKPPEWFEGSGMTYGGEIGDYGPLDAEMATVVWDDRKFAECYSNEDAAWLAEALKKLYPKR